MKIDEDNDLLTCIINDLLIPKTSVKVKSLQEAIAIVSDDWIFQLTQNSSIVTSNVVENISSFELLTELHHGSTDLNGYSKLYICCFNSLDLDRAEKPSIDDGPISFGKFHEALADQCFYQNWKTVCLNFFNCYNAENFKTEGQLQFFYNCNLPELQNYNVDASFESQEQSYLVTSVNCWNHVNILPILAIVHFRKKAYLIKKCISHSVYDSLTYSPCMLSTSNAKPLFLIFQLIKIMHYLSTIASEVQIRHLTWKQVSLDKLLWIQADIHSYQDKVAMKSSESMVSSEKTISNQLVVETETLQTFLDLWICGKISNYDYLMFLNKLAGRRMNDPHHHPIFPWVSDLSVDGGGWRDFTKSKYRLNKGDDQLQLQYGMAASTPLSAIKENIPYHVPDMLSDITYYVYKARAIPKTILQKHVRSYWEPNEYPSTVQRMQEWTPDECIPEFFTDPSIFKSHHSDMGDLGVPDWCESPEDFVQKHMAMLESDYVSRRLHEWIDVTFGYKLSGKYAIQCLNVCRQLVDRHSDPTTRGIVQLFRHPHPQKRATVLFSPEKILHGIKMNALMKSNSFDRNADADTSEVSVDGNSSGRDDEFGSSEELNSKSDEKLRFPDDFDPSRNLDQLEKLLVFKINETDEWGLSQELREVLQSNIHNLAKCSYEEMTADRHMLALMCMIAEFFLLSHGDTLSGQALLSDRLRRASVFFDSNKHLLPTTVKNGLKYLFASLAAPVKRICEELKKSEKLEAEGKPPARIKLFKPINSRGYPSPHPLHLLTEAMQIFHFPVYFDSLHSFIGKILVSTNYYTRPLLKEDFGQVKHDLSLLLQQMHDNEEGITILMLHIKRLLSLDPQHSALALHLMFDLIAQELGPDLTRKELLPSIVNIYNELNNGTIVQYFDDEFVKNVVETLYDKFFLVQLLSRLGLRVFLETFSRPLAECLVAHSSCAGVLVITVQWLLNLLGPTLSSKYLIRNMLLALNSCYTDTVFYDDESQIANDELLLNCLVYASSLYGVSLITLQYLPHISYSVSSAIRGTCFTDQSYAALKAATSLLVTIVPHLSDHVLMEELHRMSKEIIMPLIGVISSKRLKFPGGGEQRKYLCFQIVDLLQLIAVRIGREMARNCLTVLLQSFFCNFSIHNDPGQADVDDPDDAGFDGFNLQFDEAVVIPSSLEPATDSITAAVMLSGMKVDQSDAKAPDPDPQPKPLSRHVSVVDSELAAQIHDELLLTFGPESAYRAYVPFARLMGGLHLDNILKDNGIVWRLSSRFSDPPKDRDVSDLNPGTPTSISLVGNRMVADDNADVGGASSFPKKSQIDDEFHLKGNWLAYWEHEIGLAGDDDHIHFNQIDLNSYQGHTSAVKSLYVNNTEEWFLSGSKDKTVKIWSLSNGSCDVNTPLFAYQHHKKSVFFTAVQETSFNVISCDGSLHLWDPFVGRQIKVFESSDFKSGVTTVCPLSPPQQQILISTSDSVVKMIDLRSHMVAQEYRSIVSANVGVIKTLCSMSYWAAVGFTSGVISFIDIRMGPVLRMWQAHDHEIQSSVAVGRNKFLTSALDQSISYWDANSHQPIMVYRGIPEPVHVVRSFHSEVLSATTSNKFMVHRLPPKPSAPEGAVNKAFYDKPSLQTKIRSDILKGSLTTFTVLPMKRQLLVASDSGSIKLLA